MNSVAVIAFMVSCLLCLAVATEVSQCEGQNFQNLQENVVVGSCKKPPCKLKKKTTITVDIKFTPDHEVRSLTTNVVAEVLGLPLPFVGVNGISACNKIFLPDGTTAAPCPLKAGQEYIYKNSFPIHEIYPSIPVVVHWSLSEKNVDLICFEVAARIR